MTSFNVENIDVEDFLDCLDIENVSIATESEYRFSCPFSGHSMGDENPSAYMNRETTAFFCHGCHARGNAIDFTSRVLEVSPIKAIRMLRERYQPGAIDPDARNMIEELQKVMDEKSVPPRENVVLPDETIDQFAVDWEQAEYARQKGEGFPATDYILERFRGDWALLEFHKFGYDSFTGRITLPVYDENAGLVGFKARATDDRKPKYLNLGGDRYGFEPFLKNQVVFGLHNVIKRRKANTAPNNLVLCEGEYNAIMLQYYGFNGVSINGSYFGKKQIELIREHADEVILFFDSDSAGRDATRAISQQLRVFMPVYIVDDHDGDPKDMTIVEARHYVEGAQMWQIIDLLELQK